MYLIHDANNSRQQIWAAVEDYGKGRVWEFHVHGVYRSGDPRVCPSLSMACDILGISPLPILALCPALGNEGPGV